MVVCPLRKEADFLERAWAKRWEAEVPVQASHKLALWPPVGRFFHLSEPWFSQVWIWRVNKNILTAPTYVRRIIILIISTTYVLLWTASRLLAQGLCSVPMLSSVTSRYWITIKRVLSLLLKNPPMYCIVPTLPWAERTSPFQPFSCSSLKSYCLPWHI